MLFRGKISTEIVKDGRIQRAGWASIKLEDRKFLNRKKYLTKWRNFSHLLIKVRFHHGINLVYTIIEVVVLVPRRWAKL